MDIGILNRMNTTGYYFFGQEFTALNTIIIFKY